MEMHHECFTLAFFYFIQRDEYKNIAQFICDRSFCIQMELCKRKSLFFINDMKLFLSFYASNLSFS